MIYAANYPEIPGFIELMDKEEDNGAHFIRAASIISIRPQWDGDLWTHCDVRTIDGMTHGVNASVEQIAEAMRGAVISAEGRSP